MKEEKSKKVMDIKERDDYNMNITIDKINQMENRENQKFLEYQDRRIYELKNMLDRQSKGEFVDVSEIIQDFKDIGIIDKNGNVNDYFSKIFINKEWIFW